MTAPQPASAELVALATTTRPDWPERDVRAVLAHAHTIGLSWAQVLNGMGRLMADPDAAPSELIPDVRDPLRFRRNAPLPDDRVREHAANLRAQLGHHDDQDGEQS